MSTDVNELAPGDADASGSTAEPSFADLLSEFEREHKRPGTETVGGVVIKVAPDGLYIDIGRKHEGILPLDAVRDASGAVRFQPGDAIQVGIGGRDENGYYVLSAFRVVAPRDWSGLEKAFADKTAITGTVEEVIKGGLRVDVGVRAFLPASRCGARDQAEMEKLVGQSIECRITKLDTQREDVVLDRRVVLEERAFDARRAAFDGLQEGAVVQGLVRSLMDFGAFVDLGGIDGLLHVADMSWSRAVKPADVVKVGDRVEVKILKVNRDSRKISLGMKQLSEDPWVAAARSLSPGDRVKGRVARLADFGAFVELQPGVEGLIHLSELAWSKKFKRPSDVLKEGELVEVVVLGVKVEERRIALGLKQALGDPWEEARKKFTPGAVVEGPVTSLATFGAFVELGDGVEGMIHIGDITAEKRLQHPKEALTVGQRVRAVVLEADSERRRFRLGMKQLEPSSADEYIAEHKAGDTVSGRVIEASASQAKVELGEGVRAICRIQAASQTEEKPAAGTGKADLTSLSAMLAAKWKSGPAEPQSQGARLAAGQVRRFRITSLDPDKKLIELELAD